MTPTTLRLGASLLPILLASCGAMVASRPYSVPIDSVPQGAVVTYMEHDVGVTPCTIEVGNRVRKVSLRRDGYHPQVVDLCGESNGGPVFVGILLWGPLEILVDLMAEAWTRTNDDPVKVPLTPSTDAAPPKWVRTEHEDETGNGT